MSIISFIRRYPRSLAALAVLSLAATGLSLGSGYEATAALKANFQARDATKYPSDPNLAPYGLRNIVVAYEPSLWPSGADRSQPNLSYVANTYIPRIKRQNPDVVVLDVEESDWKFTTDWLAVCGDPGKRAARYTAWHNLNLKLKPLGSAVDIIFPSVYAFYDDAKSISCYPAYAKANIKEARIYGKPVWAFVWMKYHSNGRWVSRSAFRTHLETAYAAADGLVVWSKAKNSVAWSWSAPWWLETKDFLADKRLN